MKTTILTIGLFLLLMNNSLSAQDRTTVNAHSSEISDNLDLRAVASIFGDSEDLADFERRLNDPKMQISNLDLNGDNMVDYLRVIESVEGSTHLIIIQSVIGRDLFQDVATVEVERDTRNNVQVQVVGDVYMYGRNYIYEPVYVHTPIIYNTFWVRHYRPYFSSWYWGYYPSYYYAWNPYPAHIYHNHVHVHINTHHHYNYVNVRRSQRAVALHNTRRANAYERQYPNRSFAQRTNVSNRNELMATRANSTGTRNTSATTRTPATRTENTARTQTGSRTTSTTSRSNTAGTRATTPAITRATTSRTQPTSTSVTTTRSTAPVTRSATTQRSAPVTPTQTRAVTPQRSVPQATSRPSNISMNAQRSSPAVNRPAAPAINRAAPAPNATQRSSAPARTTTPTASGRR